ncbi:UDP-N-acetylglucosamine 2-epimerase [Butyrivibrio sp. XBB1001]|uniref:UDP-N-acetylglucosamine 2-epimerase n=1 Tax=Butyrivibrio sp. XBB1001 TaxID=1280682 RepID=UPI0004089E8C|nr:UDP-N-acetylglucosamine 2-epimerase [Butyrivibrio sp. XBB1001]
MKSILFFIGTEAELIKVFPVIQECRKRNIDCHIVASGQNDIKDSVIIKKTDCGEVELELSNEKDIKKTALGLLQWWIKTYRISRQKIIGTFPDMDYANSYMIVHGDTVSTYMGARIGKKLGMTVCHVEAGLRSHNIFSPFPEEIDRLLTSRIARVHFAPGEYAYNNLRKANGRKINTYQNTLLDSLTYSKKIPIENEIIKEISGEEYCVFVMHRQENLANKPFVIDVVNEVKNLAKKTKCVILMHKITENAFVKIGVLDELKTLTNVILLPRVGYFDFMKLLNNSLFVITDGGSNQEELYYMRKPCLILRKVTERKEGLGANARLFNGEASDIEVFISQLGDSDKMCEVIEDASPSILIADFMERLIE